MALLKNVSKIWHIDINMPHTVTTNHGQEKVLRGERFKIFTHNDPVEVPDEALELKFVKDQIEAGNLIEVAAPKKKTEKAEKEDDSELEELRSEADELGIEYHHKAGVKKLKELIAEKLEE